MTDTKTLTWPKHETGRLLKAPGLSDTRHTFYARLSAPLLILRCDSLTGIIRVHRSMDPDTPGGTVLTNINPSDLNSLDWTKL